jgi:hypothetical protein
MLRRPRWVRLLRELSALSVTAFSGRVSGWPRPKGGELGELDWEGEVCLTL